MDLSLPIWKLAAMAAAVGVALGITSCAAGGSDDARESETETNMLLRPDAEAFQATAPETFRVRFETSKGDFVVEVVRAWAPNGADRFYNLVRNGYYDDVRFFRVISGFMAQFGIHGDPKVNAAWRVRPIPDDPVVESNRRGYVTFAMTSQPNSRTTQLFINYADNTQL